MFRGAIPVTLDDKGRMVMPSRFREQISVMSQGKLVVTVDRERCLLIYPLPEWDQVQSRLMALPSLDQQARRLQRLMVGHATDLDLDGHGRFLLPAGLREFAQLEKQGMLVGQGNRIELWAEARWKEQCEEWLKSEETPGGLSPDLGSLSL